jgi:hypothetical protein
MGTVAPYIPAAYPNQQPDLYSRGSSNSATEGYVAKKYYLRPPQQQGFVASSSRPSGASITDQHITFFPPTEQTGSYGRPAIEPALPSQLQPSCPGTPKDHPCGVNNGSMQSPAPPCRRSSTSSTHRRSKRSSSSRERGRRRKKHHDEKEHSDHPSSDKKKRELAKRADMDRPTLGDTLYGIFVVIKGALDPRSYGRTS